MKGSKSVATAVGAALTLVILAGALGCSDCDLEIENSSLPDGIVGIAYSFPLTSHCGGDFWYVVQGNLPPGIGLIDDGILRGVPTDVGTTSFTLGVIDTDNGDQAFKGFTLTIDPAS